MRSAEKLGEMIRPVALPLTDQRIWVVVGRLVDDCMTIRTKEDQVLIRAALFLAETGVRPRPVVARCEDVRHLSEVDRIAFGCLHKKLERTGRVLTISR